MGNPTIDRHDATGFSRHRPLTPPEDCHSAQQREDDEVDTLAPKSPREDGELVMDMGPLSSSMPVARENNVHYTTSGDEGVQFPLPRQLTPVAHFDLLTSFDSSVLPSWDTMCIPDLKLCTIVLELEQCAKFAFEMPEVAKLPQADIPTCYLKKLIVKVPIEFLYVGNSEDRIFGYLPDLVRNAPSLEYLALQLTRQKSFGFSPGNDIVRSYQTLVRGLQSASLETLIIDTCDIKPRSVRACQEDFFESLRPLKSLDGFPNLRRLVVPQEAIMWVSGRLWSTSATEFEHPTHLLPASIERVEIIDSTSALQHWAASLLNMWMGKVKVSALRGLNKLVLWCDHFYPTLVPDYRTDSWMNSSGEHYFIGGRGGRESDLLSPGCYGEKSDVDHYPTSKTDKLAEFEMRTGRKLRLKLKSTVSLEDEMPMRKKQKKVATTLIWSKLEQAGIDVKLKPDEARGWRNVE